LKATMLALSPTDKLAVVKRLRYLEKIRNFQLMR
jgi:hypothetical protein